MGKNIEEVRKFNEDAFQTEQTLALVILMEAVKFAHGEKSDYVLDLDTHKFYDYCYNKILKNVVKKNCEIMDLDEPTMLFCVRMKWVDCISKIILYNAERIRFLNLIRQFIQDYENYLNDKE